MCSGRAGAVPGRNLVPGTGSGFSFRNHFPETGLRTRGIVPGSKGCKPEVSKVSVFDGFRGVRFCSLGLDGTGSGNRVPGTRVPGQGSESYSALRKYTLVLWKYTAVPWKYFFVLWKYTYVLRKYTFVLWKYSFVRWKYIFVHWTSMLLYVESMPLYFESVILYFATMLGQRKGGHWCLLYKCKPPCCWGYHLRLFVLNLCLSWTSNYLSHTSFHSKKTKNPLNSQLYLFFGWPHWDIPSSAAALGLTLLCADSEFWSQNNKWLKRMVKIIPKKNNKIPCFSTKLKKTENYINRKKK